VEVVVEVAELDHFLGLWIESECILCSPVDGFGFQVATQRAGRVALIKSLIYARKKECS